jgi:antitoxin (DNA-binding transcriptional repressor) of toxin-antitoxin stability system
MRHAKLTDAAHDAAPGQVVYLTEHGERLAAIIPGSRAGRTHFGQRELVR